MLKIEMVYKELQTLGFQLVQVLFYDDWFLRKWQKVYMCVYVEGVLYCVFYFYLVFCDQSLVYGINSVLVLKNMYRLERC